MKHSTCPPRVAHTARGDTLAARRTRTARRGGAAVAIGCIAVALAFVTGGCSRDPLDKKVSVETQTAFAIWRTNMASNSGPELRRQVEEALLELRLNVSAERDAARREGKAASSGADDTVDEALRKQIHGRPLREVLRRGYELRVQRLKSELAGLEKAMAENAQLTTKPGDLESKHHLDELRGRQLGRVEKYRDDLAAAERELAALTKPAR